MIALNILAQNIILLTKRKIDVKIIIQLLYIYLVSKYKKHECIEIFITFLSEIDNKFSLIFPLETWLCDDSSQILQIPLRTS